MVYLGEDPALTINLNFIAQIAALRKGAQTLIQAINRGMVIKALILEVGDNMVKERERLRRLTEKMINLRDKVITQKRPRGAGIKKIPPPQELRPA